MTRLEQIAAAFPLHVQRIAECTWECGPDAFERLMALEALTNAHDVLLGAFHWSSTIEGDKYWSALCDGMRSAPAAKPDPTAYWESMYTDLLLRADATLRERDALALQVLVLEQQRDEARALGRIA